MDREKLIQLRAILESILPDGQTPTEEELDYDTEAIALYQSMEQTLQCLDDCGSLILPEDVRLNERNIYGNNTETFKKRRKR